MAILFGSTLIHIELGHDARCFPNVGLSAKTMCHFTTFDLAEHNECSSWRCRGFPSDRAI